jgi:hypothetical protein
MSLSKLVGSSRNRVDVPRLVFNALHGLREQIVATDPQDSSTIALGDVLEMCERAGRLLLPRLLARLRFKLGVVDEKGSLRQMVSVRGGENATTMTKVCGHLYRFTLSFFLIFAFLCCSYNARASWLSTSINRMTLSHPCTSPNVSPTKPSLSLNPKPSKK